MKKLFAISLIIWLGCSSDNTHSKYMRWVGDSKFNPEMDTSEFKLCNGDKNVMQYFHGGRGLEIKGEKKSLFKYFKENYVPVNNKESGWIRIRFIVNCEGETGRFRLMASDENYKEQTFDDEIVSQLLDLTQSVKGWIVKKEKENPVDYYQYIVFKMANGNLIEIMP